MPKAYRGGFGATADIDRLWDAASDAEKRILVSELVEGQDAPFSTAWRLGRSPRPAGLGRGFHAPQGARGSVSDCDAPARANEPTGDAYRSSPVPHSTPLQTVPVVSAICGRLVRSAYGDKGTIVERFSGADIEVPCGEITTLPTLPLDSCSWERPPKRQPRTTQTLSDTAAELGDRS